MLHDRPQQWVLEVSAEVDFGIVIDPGPAADLQCEVVLAEPFCCSAGRSSFASLTEVPWQALQDERLILQDYASGSRPLIDAALSRLAIRANIVRDGHPATLFPMVESGGISVLPALAPLPQGAI